MTSSDTDSDPDPITRYSQTERIVLLIDLDPLLHHHHHQDPTVYAATLISAATTLLSFPPLSTTLFSFRLFFSSLSPLLSPLSLPLSLSFDLPSPTLRLLSQSLSSLSTFNSSCTNIPKASHIASALRQLIHDYAWDTDPSYNSSSPIPSNLVLLFSPLFPSFEPLSRFFDSEESLQDVDSFSDRFCGFFGSVRDVFGSRDIHCTWVHVGVGPESQCSEKNSEIGRIFGFFESGVKGLGWGFCGADSIVLGSALVPFGLIYPKIGVYWGSLGFNDCSSRKVKVQLTLQILDVNGNPIQYNCCDLEFLVLKILPRHGGDARFNPDLGSLQGGGCERKERFWKQFSDGIAKFEVKAVQRSDAFVNLGDCLAGSVVVREVFKESKKKKKEDSVECFADRVLEMLETEFGFQLQRKSVPIWEILLSFLCREGFWALVSLTDGNGDSCMCVLRPFTVSSAFLSVLGDPDMASDFGGANVAQYFRMNKVFLDSQAKKSAAANEGHREKKKMDLTTLKNLSWSSFCDSAKNHFETDLQEVYSVTEHNKSKKLKFLKCWMKQMKKSGCGDLTLSEKPKPSEIIAAENKGKLTESPQNGEHPITPCASAEINTEASRIQDDGVLDYRSETSESFFSNLSNKIQQGTESEIIDLGAMAERLVNASIYWLCQKEDRETNSEGQKDDKETNSDSHNACSSTVAKLIKLLLREPKELAAKHKGRNSFSQSQASEPGPSTQVTKHAAREYELQILFRMEILQSEAGNGVEDSRKLKFVKQICQLLENIPCHMEGGFFGDWNLEDYVAKIIKSRYSDTLEDVVHKIYNKMDLLPFAAEDEAPNDMLNSEDSNKSWNKKVYRDEMGENDISNEPVSAENEPFHLQKNDNKKHQRVIQEDHDGKLIEARKRRERARRFSSFTSWIPDLQRVWAPKQKGMKPKTDPFQKLPKRKERKRASYDTVCETPFTGNKRSSQWIGGRGSDDENDLASGSQTSSSVSKALFQDDNL